MTEVDSMRHYEHLCSLTVSSCDAERVAQAIMDPIEQCRSCADRPTAPASLCTPNFIGA